MCRARAPFATRSTSSRPWRAVKRAARRGSSARCCEGSRRSRPSGTGAAKAPPWGLTARESEILALLQQGLSNKVISRRLGIELATVKNHVHSVFGKLGLRRRAEAAVLVQADAKTARDGDESSLETAAG